MKKVEELALVIVYTDKHGKWYEHDPYGEPADDLEMADWLEALTDLSEDLQQKRARTVAALRQHVCVSNDERMRDEFEELLNGITWDARVVQFPDLKEKDLEELAAIRWHYNWLGSRYDYNEDCEPADRLELAEWFRRRTYPEGELTETRNALVSTLMDLANFSTDKLFDAVAGRIHDVTNGEMASVSWFLDVPNDSPLIEKLETACLDLKETWEGMGLTYMDLDELLGRWGYMIDGPEECHNDIGGFVSQLIQYERTAQKEAANGKYV